MRRHCFSVILFLVRLFALLVCNAAAGFAGRLAGSLALAAAAVLCALAKVAGLDGIYVFHLCCLQIALFFYIITHAAALVNYAKVIFAPCFA